MIEMSVDKETVTTRNTKVETIPPLQPQQLSECTGSCNNAPKMPEVTLANPDNADGAATCPMPANVAQTKHTSSGDTHNETENVGQQASVSEDHLNPKNGLQQQQHQQQQQQQQQQKLTKRRSTMNVGFKHPQSGKRRRRANSESDSVLPTNFLLGGNIFDPLNLNSLLDEEVNKALNAETPKSSPLPAKSRDPVEILIPRDITDPLNLNSGVADSSLLVSPLKSGGRRRHRNRHHGGGGGGAGGVSASQFDLLESERGSEVNNSSSSLPKLTLGSSASGSLLEGPRVSSTQSSVTVDSHGCNEINSSICKDEAILPVSAPQAQPRGPEDSSTTTAGGLNQLSTRQRKRRRNSGKTEPPLAHCTNMAKPGTEDSGQGTGAGRHTQSFHTPVSGRAGTGSRQQQPHNQHRQQPHQHKQKFQYGNYNKYYGYRNPGCSEDPRIHVLRPEWFRGKAVLDLGCNTGHLTLCIAKKLRPARILGLDIDGGLVHAARQNIRHYLSELQAQEARLGMGEEKGEKPNNQEKERKGDEMHSGRETQRERQKMDKQCEGELRAENGNAEKLVKGGNGPAEAADDNGSSRHTDGKGQDRGAKEMEKRDSGMPAVDLASCSFPVSLRVSRGPIAAPPLPETPLMPPGNFPSNVSFVKGNYVLESDALLLTQRPEYDVILCFSVTKWVHLNWGDTGLKRLFHRVYRHLRPGGRFILEPQQWPTYSRRKNLTDSIFKNYQSIRLKPDEFSTYLTSEVGFSSYELIGIPTSSSRGFQRPIYLFHK